MKVDWPVSLDVLLLLVLVPAQVALNGQPYLLVIPFLIYIVLELWIPLGQYDFLPESLGRIRLNFLVRLFLLLVMITAAVIIPTVESIRDRNLKSQSDPIPSSAYQGTHDGAIQMELALELLANGKNPYVESYDDTPLNYYGFSNLEITQNPALDHFVYLPGYLLVSFPLFSIFEGIDILYDQRLIYFLAFIIMILLIPLLVEPPALKLLILAAIGLNPLLTGPVIYGILNDVLVLLIIVGMVLMLVKNRLIPAAIFMGVACAFKQSAWFVIPFFALFLAARYSNDRPVQQIAKLIGIAAIVTLIITVPFALWDFNAFVTDVFAYPSGSVPINYPIRGYTIGTLLVGMNLIKSPTDPFPFWIFQILLGVPLLIFLLKYQWRRNSVGSMILAAGVFTFGLGAVSRFFQDNYVGYVAVLVILGVIIGFGEAALSSDMSQRLPASGMLTNPSDEEE